MNKEIFKQAKFYIKKNCTKKSCIFVPKFVNSVYMKIKVYLLVVMCFMSCNKDLENQDILTLKIASWRTKYTGNMESHPPYTYYVQYVNSNDREKFPYTTKDIDSEWEKFAWVIENFDYVEGYEYIVTLTTIKIDPDPLVLS